MIIYRRNKLPLLYSWVEFLRFHSDSKSYFCDCKEDLGIIRELQSIADGKKCLSEIEPPAYMYIAAIIPDDVKTLQGDTNRVYGYQVYFYKTYDILTLLGAPWPSEAVNKLECGLDLSEIQNLGGMISCVKWIEHTIEMYGSENVQISMADIKKISELEKKRMAANKLSSLKRTDKRPRRERAQVPPSRRNSVLQRDEYTCIFCGRSKLAHEIVLEVNHIIPVSLIKRLDLNRELELAAFNLCTTCFDCNRGKSDTLSMTDVDFYLEHFSRMSGFEQIIDPLLKIKTLQKAT